MAVFKDRVWETTATTGTGDYTLDGATTGYQSFNDAFPSGSFAVHYCCTDGTDWEVGEGTFNGLTTITRDTIFESTNSDAAVNWGSGDKDIFMVASAAFLGPLTNIQFGAVPGTEPTASYSNAFAIGDTAVANETYNLAIGYGAQAGQSPGSTTEQGALAIGHLAKAYEYRGIALGYACEAGVSGTSTAEKGVAIGTSAKATASTALAIGDEAEARGATSIAIGDLAIANEQSCIALGTGAGAGQTSGGVAETFAFAVYGDAYELRSIAIGYTAKAGVLGKTTCANTIAIGYGAKAGNVTATTPAAYNSIAIGVSAEANDLAAIAIGDSARAGISGSTGLSNTIAIGVSAIVNGSYGLAVGSNTYAWGLQCTAIGQSAESRESECIAIGDAQAGQVAGGTTNLACIAIGDTAKAYELGGIAIGDTAEAGGSSGSNAPRCVAIGHSAHAYSNPDAVAIGVSSTATGDSSLALGAGIYAWGANSIAIGHQADARDDNTIRIGYDGQAGQSAGGTGDMYAIAIGYNSFAYEQSTIVIGANSTAGTTSGAAAVSSILIGDNITNTSYEHAFAVGEYAKVTRDFEHTTSIDRAVTNVHRRGSMGMAIVTSDATPTALNCGLTGDPGISVPTESILTFHALVCGIAASPNDAAAYEIKGAITNFAGTTSLLGTPLITILGEDNSAWDVSVSADNSNNRLVFTVTGAAATAIEWSAAVQYVEAES